MRYMKDVKSKYFPGSYAYMIEREIREEKRLKALYSKKKKASKENKNERMG